MSDNRVAPRAALAVPASLLLWCALALGASAQDGPTYRLSYLPDEQNNLICFSRQDALDLLTSFRTVYLAEERPRVRRLLRGFTEEFGQNRRYDCSFVFSIYVPTLPIQAVDLVEERGLDWEGRDEHYFVATNILVGETKYTQTATGGPIFVFTSDAVILKE